jgi:D-amino-acid dehydrogenase
MEKQHITVIGAGIVGVCNAIELARAGHWVSLLESGEIGGEQAASYGNGAWISPASVVPVAMPGLWRLLPQLLFNKQSPLSVVWQDLPQLLPWLCRFMWAGATDAKVSQTARLLQALLHDSPQQHAALAQAAGVSELIVPSGLLYVYPDETAFKKEALAWRLRSDTGLRWEAWDAAKLRRELPDLDPRYRFAAYVLDGAFCRQPGAYVAALARYAQSLGVRLITERALGFRLASGRLLAVTTASGEVLSVVLAILPSLGMTGIANRTDASASSTW